MRHIKWHSTEHNICTPTRALSHAPGGDRFPGLLTKGYLACNFQRKIMCWLTADATGCRYLTLADVAG